MEENEGPEIWDYLRDVWKQMKATVYAGLNTEGVLHGGLGVQRKAKYLVRQRHMDESPRDPGEPQGLRLRLCRQRGERRRRRGGDGPHLRGQRRAAGGAGL